MDDTSSRRGSPSTGVEDEAFFRQAYESDESNKGRQSWDDYAGWVAAFYEGKRFPPVPGWESRRRDLTARLTPDHRDPVLDRLDDIGKLLAGEWAKDNAVRKVTTDQLKAYGKLLERAARADPGDGRDVLKAADAVEQDLARRIGGSGDA